MAKKFALYLQLNYGGSIMEIIIENYKDNNWSYLKKFLKTHWSPDHPILNQKLFSWQYKGFGPLSSKPASKLLYVNGELTGFRGVIPGIYQFFDNNQRFKLKGGSFAMFLLRPDCRGQSLGGKLFKNVESELDVVLSAGVNVNTAVPIYMKYNYTFLKNLNRYVIPLDYASYHKLLSSNFNKEELKMWEKKINLSSFTEPIDPKVEQLHELWDRSTSKAQLFSLYRNADFWRWRYKDSPGFIYYFFGDPLNVGVVIARIESVYGPDNPDVHKLKVLRIIEILPFSPDVWEGKNNKDMIDLIQSVLSWGKEHGCCAADFQCSTKRLENILFKVGFKQQNFDYSPDICSLAGLFQPFKLKPAPINALWKVKYPKVVIQKIDPNDTYIVKSDNDMDRTNYWPPIDGPIE